MAKLSQEELQSQKEALKQYKTTPAYAVQRFNLARTNLLIALVLTVVNILLYCLNVNMYMLFSISYPYYWFDTTDLIGSIPAIIVLAGYVVLYLFSKKNPGLMIAAMVAFIIDCLFLVGYSAILVNMIEEATFGDFLMDYLTHIWVLVYLIIGTKFTKRYKAAVTEHPELLEGSLFKNADLPPVPMPEETAEPMTEAAEAPAWAENTEAANVAAAENSADNQ